MENSNTSRITKPSKLIAAIIYVCCIGFIGAILIMLSMGIIGQIKGVGFYHAAQFALSKPEEMTDLEASIYYAGQGIGNSLCYLLMFISIVFYMRDDFKNDFMELKSNRKFYSIYIPIAAVLFVVLAVITSLLFNKITPESNNQTSIEQMMKTSAAVPLIISTVFFAPVVEEAIYRKCIFYGFRKFNVVLAYIASTILFALPHMISTPIQPFKYWILTSIPYFLDGAMLCAVYHLSKKNIYASICAHMLNNLIAVILVFV